MANPTTEGITAWSLSRLTTYEGCPRQAYYKFVKKLNEPKGQAMERGIKIHEQAEALLVRGGRVPADLKLMEEQLKELKKLKPLVEIEYAFTAKWEPTDWFGSIKPAWCRVKADALVPPVADADEPEVRVIDFKTGKIKAHGEYDDQLELYGLAGLLTFPTAVRATGELWFLDHNEVVQAAEPVLRAQAPKLQKKWELRVKKMLNDKRFDPKPGNSCRWCHFRRANNGPCEY